MFEIKEYRSSLEKIIRDLSEDLKSLRTGRATPALLEKIEIEVYQSRMPLIQLAAINLLDAKTISIEPWDKNILKEIENSLKGANLGFGIINDGKTIKVTVPPMTEERRKEILKVVSLKVEEAKIKIRKLRDEIKGSIIEKERAKEISEDEKFRLFKKMEELIKEFNDKVREIKERKEEEILKI